MGVPVFSSTRN